MAKMTTVIFLFVATYFVTCASGKGIISSRLQKRFLDGGNRSPQNVMVSFNQDIQTVLDQINHQNFTDDNEKRTAQTAAQQQFTENAQQGLKSFLGAQGVQSESFWIDNTMFVPNASLSTVNAIASFPGVASVQPEEIYHLDYRLESEEIYKNRTTRQVEATWGIRRIRADAVWERVQGLGIVVATIDTGVRYTHESLRDRWREYYGWFDPYHGTEKPDDHQGHGTHVMGTIAGSRGIGVAPQAIWISCRGCDTGGCSGSALRACGQWIQCPTDYRGNYRDCSKAPQVVCNSWGGGRGDTSYSGVVNSWRNAGIIPVFAIGNSGPECDTANSPGDLPNVIGVGSIDENDRIARYSSLGPNPDGRIKPDIVAPGNRIVSASHRSDTRYVTLSGTSMAAPHVAGVIALMKEKQPYSDYDRIYQAIKSGNDYHLDYRTAKTCGGRPGETLPNNVFGHGLIDTLLCLYVIQ